MNVITISPGILIVLVFSVCIVIIVLLFLYRRAKNELTKTKSFISRLFPQIKQLFDLYNQQQIAGSEDIDGFLEVCIRTAVTLAEAEGGALCMAGRETGDELVIAAEKNISPFVSSLADDSPTGLRVSLQEPLIRRVIGTGKADCFHREDFDFSSGSLLNLEHIQSVMSFPFRHNNEILGVLCLIRKKGDNSFSAATFDMLLLFTFIESMLVSRSIDFIHILQNRSIETETRIAGHIQKLVNPGKISDREELSFAVYSASAPGIYTDYYDVFKVDENRYVLLVCEVAGKSVPAGLVMLMIRTLVRLISRTKHEAGRVVEIINSGIAQKIDMDHFAAFNYILYDHISSEIDIVCAGYMPVLIFHHDTQEVEKIAGEDPPLGIDKKSRYKKHTVHVSTGDVILLLTDGIIEALSPEGVQYGISNLISVITENYYLSAEDLKSRVRDHLVRFTQVEEPHDDQTLLIMKIS